MGSTFIHRSLASLFAPWAGVCDSSLPHVFVFHLLAQPALPSSGQGLQRTQVWRWCCSTWAMLHQLAFTFLFCTCVGMGKVLWVVGRSKLGLGPQQRGSAAAWAAQKSSKVTIALCSALVRPHQGTVSHFGSTRTGKTWTSRAEFRGGPRMVRAEEYLREQGLLSPGRALSSRLHPPMGRLLRPGSPALRRGTRWEDMRQHA